MVYLDSAATTYQKPPEVIQAVLDAMQCAASPGRGSYPGAENAGEIVFSARKAAKKLFDLSDERHVIFTKNATEALNIAIQGYSNPGDEVIVSCLEHNAVIRPLETGRRKWRIAYFPAEYPEFAVAAFKQLITRRTRLVVCTLVSNVFGCVLPCAEIGGICRLYNIPFVVDASQGAGCIGFSPERLYADAVCMPGHKGLYGPQGTGMLLLSGRTIPRSLIQGGTGTVSAEYRQPVDLPEYFESGTPNVPGINGLTEGMRFVLKHTPDAILKHERKLINRLIEEVRDAFFMPGLADGSVRAGVLALVPKRGSVEEIEMRLIRAGICTRSGLQCAPLAHRSQGTFGTGVIRISTSLFNTEEEIDFVAGILTEQYLGKEKSL